MTHPSTPNLFPAILLAGPPHCGKSVLSYLLSQELRRRHKSHYLLRAAPDGEGDYFLEGNSDLVRRLRLNNKGEYTPDFVQHMRSVVESRMLPLLVDIGGKPQPDQLGILRACTHSILLYRTDEEYRAWRSILDPMELLPVAELRSSQADPERITQAAPALEGVICGLEREAALRRTGAVFAALLERVAGICTYSEAALEDALARRAPFPLLSERRLAEQRRLDEQRGLDPPGEGELPLWNPQDLSALQRALPAGQPAAIYGRGPVWLAAFLAAHALPAECALFDVRFGWLPPSAVIETDEDCLEGQVETVEAGWDFLSLKVTQALEPGPLRVFPLDGDGGLAISARLPRWAFAGLARHFAPRRAWVGIHEPRNDHVVVVHSRIPSISVGDVRNRQ